MEQNFTITLLQPWPRREEETKPLPLKVWSLSSSVSTSVSYSKTISLRFKHICHLIHVDCWCPCICTSIRMCMGILQLSHIPITICWFPNLANQLHHIMFINTLYEKEGVNEEYVTPAKWKCFYSCCSTWKCMSAWQNTSYVFLTESTGQ